MRDITIPVGGPLHWGHSTRFLVAGDHQRIAYIAGWEGASTQRDREIGFRDGLAEHGAAVFARELGNFVQAEAAEAARRMFGRREHPDAVFVANDHMAFAVMDVLRFELSLRVPEDVSVVGFDDVPPAAWPAYSLTTGRQRANLMVEQSVKVLLNMIENPDAAPEQVVIPCPLIIRNSATKPAGWPQ